MLVYYSSSNCLFRMYFNFDSLFIQKIKYVYITIKKIGKKICNMPKIYITNTGLPQIQHSCQQFFVAKLLIYYIYVFPIWRIISHILYGQYFRTYLLGIWWFGWESTTCSIGRRRTPTSTGWSCCCCYWCWWLCSLCCCVIRNEAHPHVDRFVTLLLLLMLWSWCCWSEIGAPQRRQVGDVAFVVVFFVNGFHVDNCS